MTKIVIDTKYRSVMMTLPEDDYSLGDMLEFFEDMLRAHGYHFDGQIDVYINDEEEGFADKDNDA